VFFEVDLDLFDEIYQTLATRKFMIGWHLKESSYSDLQTVDF
jgi:hypothetical protein